MAYTSVRITKETKAKLISAGGKFRYLHPSPSSRISHEDLIVYLVNRYLEEPFQLDNPRFFSIVILVDSNGNVSLSSHPQDISG